MFNFDMMKPQEKSSQELAQIYTLFLQKSFANLAIK